jgi:hypothetical protein
MNFKLLGSIFCLSACVHCAAAADLNPMKNPVNFGVLGDSDSHSFHDRVLLNEPKIRGGEFRAVTYQWTEIIARLRPQQINMGEWSTWGMPGRFAAMLGWIGFEDRAPRKEDYRYNFAISGAKCESLTTGMSRQTQRLVYLMDRDPAAWVDGIITIRIGINSIGTHAPLARFAHSGLSTAAQTEVDECAGYVRDAVQLIRAKHKTTRIVLIGILNNSDFIPWISHWKTPQELQNIAAVMDAYDAALKQMAATDANILFWDDRAWFAHYFGDRDEQGQPRYHGTSLGGRTITYTQDDAPFNAILADNHAGTVWNGLWARDLLEALNRHFGYAFTPITTQDIANLADPDGKLGIAAPRQ